MLLCFKFQRAVSVPVFSRFENIQRAIAPVFPLLVPLSTVHFKGLIQYLAEVCGKSIKYVGGVILAYIIFFDKKTSLRDLINI